MSDQPIALITGASRGLGAALAETLAPDFHVVGVARTTGALEELDDRIQAKGGTATLAPLDVADNGAMAHLCRSIYDRWGGISLWCHTAIHAPPLAPADHVDAKDWSKTEATNISATAGLIPMVSPLLQGSEKTALFFEDVHVGPKFAAAYTASKSAQIALARAWASETKKHGPSVQVLAPSPMKTALRARFFPGEDRAALAEPKSEAARLLAEVGLT